jgi:predicted Rossmann fold flavoprotein
MTTNVDVVVIGAGASGYMCAIEAGKRERSVLILDHANKAGKKILMSGGGRCNFTNMEVLPSHFLSKNPHFVKSALKRYGNWDFIGMVMQYEIPYHERDFGQLFCDDSAKDILNMLQSELDKAGGKINLKTEISKIEYKNDQWLISTNKGDYLASSLVVATGGLSIPTMGATGFGFDIGKQFGHQIEQYRASLVPFTFNNNDKELWSSLSGISLPVKVEVGKQAFFSDLLLTHRGLSGPAILQISNYWSEGESVEIDLLAGDNAMEWLLEAQQDSAKSMFKTVLATKFAKRMSEVMCQAWFAEFAELQMANLSKAKLTQIAQQINHWQFKPGGTEGYRTAEVTLGGISTEQISSKTMQSELQENLYFIGEVVDVTGWLGGYNFQWAWSSGYAAGQVV